MRCSRCLPAISLKDTPEGQGLAACRMINDIGRSGCDQPLQKFQECEISNCVGMLVVARSVAWGHCSSKQQQTGPLSRYMPFL